MKELEIKYELTFSCDDYLMEKIEEEMPFVREEAFNNETEEEIFEWALDEALQEYFPIGWNEREAIVAQSDKIYEWWKENKKNV